MANKEKNANKLELTTNEIYVFTGSNIPEKYITKNAKNAGIFYYTANSLHENSVLKKSLWNQWIRTSMEEIKNCSSYSEAHQAWENAPTMSFVKDIAREKMLSLTNNKKKVLNIFRSSPGDSLIKQLAFEKYQSL